MLTPRYFAKGNFRAIIEVGISKTRNPLKQEKNLGVRRVWWNRKMIDLQVEGKSNEGIIGASDR